MIAAHDMEFLSVINKLYDLPEEHREKRRHYNEGKDLVIAHPQINILAGSQPKFLANLLPEEAWGMGFTSRMILIYSGSGIEPGDIFGEELEDREVLFQSLAKRLGAFSEAQGVFMWSPEAKAMFNTWNKAKCHPIPEHSKLVSYLPRRSMNVVKLAMVSALSRSGTLEVEELDVIRGRDWMLIAEQAMPDIFREMAGKSDNDVLMELHYFMWQTMTQKRARKQKPWSITEGEMYNFLKYRVPSEKIARILEVADRSRIISRDPQNPANWIAKPKHLHGVE